MSGTPVSSCGSPSGDAACSIMRETDFAAGLADDAERSVPDAAQAHEDSVVVCRVPGTDAVIHQIWLPSGRCVLRELPERLGMAKIPVIGLSPSPEVVERAPGGKPSAVLLEPGEKYEVVLGAMPLIRFEPGPDCQPRVHEAALWMLRRLEPPLRLVALAGIGRCGKSSTASGITRQEGEGQDVERFSVGHDEEPETDGANMVVVPNPHGPGCIIVIDCEGSDNPLTQDLGHYRALVTVIFASVSQVVHCCEGSVKESTIEDIAATIAHREALISTGESRADGGATGDRRYWPELSLLLIADKFQFTQQKLDKMLQGFEGQSTRAQARNAIRQSFNVVHMQTLPHNKTQEYDNAICRLRDYLFGCATTLTNSGLNLNGAQVGETLVNICAEYEEAAKDEHSNLKVQPDSIYARVVEGHLTTLMKRHLASAREGLPKVEHYCEWLEEEGLHSQVESLLEAFDKETDSIISDRKQLLRNDLRTDLHEACRELLLENERQREAEEQRACDMLEALQQVFKRQLPAHPLQRVVLDHELDGFSQRESEQLDTLSSQTSAFYCKQVVDDANARLRIQLANTLDELKLANQALQATVAQEIENTIACEEKRFMDCVPKLSHYVNHADVIQPLEERRDLGRLTAIEAVEPIRAKGSWEGNRCDASILELKTRLDSVCLQLVEQNEAFAREDEHRCCTIRERILSDVTRIISEASSCPPRVEAHRILRVEEHDELSRQIHSFESVYDGETKSLACGKAVAEQKQLLSEALTSNLNSLRAQSMTLRFEVCNAAIKRHTIEFDSFHETLPEVGQWLPPSAVEHLDTRPQHLSAFDAALAPLQQRGEVEIELCKEERGRLSEAMDKNWNEFLEQISSEKDKDQILAAHVAKEITDDANRRLPSVPLQGELLNHEELSKLDQSKEWLGTFDEKTENIACRPVVEEEGHRLRSNLTMRVNEIWKDNNEKEITKKSIRQAMDECTSLFTELLPVVEHYVHGLAERNPAAGVLENFQNQTNIHTVKGDWEQRHLEAQQATLQSRFHALFASLEQRNESFKRSEEVRCSGFASELLDSFVRAKLPALPLQKVVTPQQQEHICVAESLLLGEFDQRTEAAGMRCHEVVGAGRSALKQDLQARVDEVRRASSERKDQIAQRLQELSSQCMHELDEVVCPGEGDKKYTEAMGIFSARASEVLWHDATCERGEWEEEILQSETARLDAALQRALRRVKRRRWIPRGAALAAAAAALWVATGVAGWEARSLANFEAWQAPRSLLVQPEPREIEPNVQDDEQLLSPHQSPGPSSATTLEPVKHTVSEFSESSLLSPHQSPGPSSATTLEAVRHTVLEISESSVMDSAEVVPVNDTGSSLESGESEKTEPASSLAASSILTDATPESSTPLDNESNIFPVDEAIPEATSESKDEFWHADGHSLLAGFEGETTKSDHAEEGVDPWYRSWSLWLVSSPPLYFLTQCVGANLMSMA